MNSNYVRGRAFEYEVMKELKAEGQTVFRTAGSHGQYDLIAFGRDYVTLIQCKTKLVNLGTGFNGARSKVFEKPIFKCTYPVRGERWTKLIQRRKK